MCRNGGSPNRVSTIKKTGNQRSSAFISGRWPLEAAADALFRIIICGAEQSTTWIGRSGVPQRRTSA
jgi:hypothetical protein